VRHPQSLSSEQRVAALRAARIELAIREWAPRDLPARQALDEADASRISYIAQCLSALGFGIAEEVAAQAPGNWCRLATS
jgi:hypothetical protein